MRTGVWSVALSSEYLAVEAVGGLAPPPGTRVHGADMALQGAVGGSSAEPMLSKEAQDQRRCRGERQWGPVKVKKRWATPGEGGMRRNLMVKSKSVSAGEDVCSEKNGDEAEC